MATPRATVQAFAEAFYAELDRESWGDIDPWLFETIATDPPEEWDEEAQALAECIERALQQAGFTTTP